jgi:catechol-2,3-dioxygenase
MLGDKEATATVAVKDLDRAKKFYEGTLGLRTLETEGDEAVTYRTGSSKLLVYRSQYAGTNKATAAGFVVGDDMETEVRTLKDKGVRFEHYDLPGMKREGDVHVAGDMRAAWFKDPDGNILSMTSR